MNVACYYDSLLYNKQLDIRPVISKVTDYWNFYRHSNVEDAHAYGLEDNMNRVHLRW